MKHLSYLFLFTFFLFSCQKTNPDLGSEYQNLVGEWKVVSADEQFTNATHVEFKKNGRIIIENGPQRGWNFKAKKKLSEASWFVNGQTILILRYGLEKKEFVNYVQVYKQQGFVDTIELNPGSYVESDTLVSKRATFYRVH